MKSLSKLVYYKMCKIMNDFDCDCDPDQYTLICRSLNGLSPWIGFSDVQSNDNFVWVTGSNVIDGYANWADGN